MKYFQTPFYLGNLLLKNNIFYAPLAGCSDLCYRQMTNYYQPGLIYCEMVKMDALIRYDSMTFRLLDYESSMHPIGAQICGSKVSISKNAAKIIEDLGFDTIDLNCGCPVDKVTKDGSGSGLLKNPELIGDILVEMCTAVSIPVTVKIRSGWDDENINAALITKIAEDAGAQAITIHGRTRKQAYKGFANRDIIRECKKVAKNIKVIGNGDIFDPSSAFHMFEHTKCDAILISRGTMGQPWIVEDIENFFKGNHFNRSGDFIKNQMLKHFNFILNYKPERKALLDMRRVGCYYLKRYCGVKNLRNMINKALTTKQMLEIIEEFNFNESL
jgi:tRNA-dihydrouridine synthase B